MSVEVDAAVREAAARWLAEQYGGTEYADGAASNDHWLGVADELLTVVDQAHGRAFAAEQIRRRYKPVPAEMLCMCGQALTASVHGAEPPTGHAGQRASEHPDYDLYRVPDDEIRENSCEERW